MLEGKAVVGEADMLQKMQQDMLHLAAKALDLFDVTESIDIACFIKKVTSQTDLYWDVIYQVVEANLFSALETANA
ncbi:hypothetical protein EZV62_026576 [Acer yangbiense]|uniref:Uncharacterized protein n=1 Tax=Acer yangbiense TaxID=1000413 RepID=A0A5C7GSJ1_9ROSI|nr:hypothetical protein EZV62_026576 [Acer yangbiense]